MKIQLLQTGPLGVNCYLLEDEESRQAAVIDPGGDAPEILAALEGADLRYILLTHGHYDHVGGAAALAKAAAQARVYLHRDDYLETDLDLFPLRSQLEDVTFYGEGDEIPLGGAKLRVLATPGHSRGSVTLLLGDLMFCGDTLFAGSCGRTDFPGGDMEEMMSSLRRLGELEGDFRVCPGHMELTTLDQERRTNPYLRQALRRAP